MFIHEKEKKAIVKLSLIHGLLNLLRWGKLIIISMMFSRFYTGLQTDRDLLTGGLVLCLLLFLEAWGSKWQFQKKNQFAGMFNSHLRERFIRSVFIKGPDQVEKEHSGGIAAMAWANVEWIGLYYREVLPAFFADGFFYTGLLLFLGWQKPALLLPMILYLLYSLYRPLKANKKLDEIQAEEAEATQAFSSYCLDGLRGVTSLKSLDGYDLFRDKLKEKSRAIYQAAMAGVKITARNQMVIQALKYAGLLACLMILQVDQGLSLLWTMINLSCLYLFFQRASFLQGDFLRRSKAKEAMRDLKVWLVESDPKERTERTSLATRAKEAISAESALVFHRVSFTYPGQSRPTLRDLNFRIARRSRVALIGPSGAGKSTLISLLAAFYECDSGTIYLNGHNFTGFDSATRRRHLVIIWQDNHIFNRSLFENVKLAKDDATREEVEDACKKARLEDLLKKLPDGLDTVLGDGGQSLSGGERQRVALARAFLSEADLVVLDEIASQLDRQNEERIQSALEKLAEQKTVMMITHRLDKLDQMDSIILLDRGRIIEQAGHRELMETSSLYRSMLSGEKGRRRGGNDDG